MAALVAVALLAGCASRRPLVPAGPAARESGATSAPRLSPAELERRADAHAHFATGIVRDLRNEPREAEASFRAAVLADTGHEQLALDLAQRHLQNREPLKAVEILTRAGGQPGASGQVFGWLGAAQLQATNVPAAIAAYREAIRRAPQSILGYHGLASLHLQNQQTNEALAVLDAGAAQPDATPGFLVDLAGFQIAAGRQRLLPTEVTKPRALTLLDRAARLNSAEPVVRQRMAEGYKALGEVNRATALYEELLRDHEPDTARLRLALREQLFQLYVHAGDTAKARQQLEAIVSDNPANPQMYALLGALCAEEKQLPEAEANFEKALLLDPTLEPVYYDLAGVQLALRKVAEAGDTIERARGRFRVGYLTELYSGLVMAAQRKYPEAINHLGAAELHARVSEPARLNDFFYFQVGAANERAGRYAEAEAALRKCLELSPENAEALNYLGYMWADRAEKLDEAKTLIERALKLEPDNAAYLDSLAWVLFKLGRPAEALAPQLRALELNEEPDATLLDHLGDIYHALGRHAEAREAWEQSLAVESNPDVQKKLQADPAPTAAN